MRLHGASAAAAVAPQRVVALPAFEELLDEAWSEVQRLKKQSAAERSGSGGVLEGKKQH